MKEKYKEQWEALTEGLDLVLSHLGNFPEEVLFLKDK